MGIDTKHLLGLAYAWGKAREGYYAAHDEARERNERFLSAEDERKQKSFLGAMQSVETAFAEEFARLVREVVAAPAPPVSTSPPDNALMFRVVMLIHAPTVEDAEATAG